MPEMMPVFLQGREDKLAEAFLSTQRTPKAQDTRIRADSERVILLIHGLMIFGTRRII